MKVGKKQIYIIVLELCALLCSALYLGLYGSSLTSLDKGTQPFAVCDG